jgi:phosphocarrier protein HPr
MTEGLFKITYPNGLHARPATMVVVKASGFQSDFYLTYQGVSVNMKSIMGVLSLSIPEGAQFKIAIKGNDEVDAMTAIQRTINEINHMKG